MAEFIKHYEVLLNKAKVDLKAALNLLDDINSGDEELDYEVVLFHLHQCAEKFMKSLFAFHELELTVFFDKFTEIENPPAILFEKKQVFKVL